MLDPPLGAKGRGGLRVTAPTHAVRILPGGSNTRPLSLPDARRPPSHSHILRGNSIRPIAESLAHSLIQRQEVPGRTFRARKAQNARRRRPISRCSLINISRTRRRLSSRRREYCPGFAVHAMPLLPGTGSSPGALDALGAWGQTFRSHSEWRADEAAVTGGPAGAAQPVTTIVRDWCSETALKVKRLQTVRLPSTAACPLGAVPVEH